MLGTPVEAINDDRLYRALDHLPSHKAALEVHFNATSPRRSSDVLALDG
jgi:hypothetical protein